MTGRRLAQLFVASLAVVVAVGGEGCSNILDVGDYTLCGPVGAGGCGGGGGGLPGDDGGSDGPSPDSGDAR